MASSKKTVKKAKKGFVPFGKMPAGEHKMPNGKMMGKPSKKKGKC